MDLLIFLRNKISYKILSVQIHFNLGHISIFKKKPPKLHFFFNYRNINRSRGVWKHAVIPYPEKNHEHGVNLVVCVTPTPFQKILTE